MLYIKDIYNNLEGKDDDEKIDEIVSIERERHKFKNQEYTEKQLEKTFENIRLLFLRSCLFCLYADRMSQAEGALLHPCPALPISCLLLFVLA